MSKEKLIVILGPTSVGKTKVSVDIAKKLKSEIISTDSMQIYKKMNIGTAKVTEEEKSGIKHHMIDLIDPGEEFTVYDYQNQSLKIIDRLIKEDKTPILVGGSGLYINSILYDLDFNKVSSNEEVRNKYYEIEKAKGKEYLYDLLEKRDPEAAKKIHPNNIKRVVRALEVTEITGEKYSENSNFRKYSEKYDFIIIGLEMNRKLLYNRINARVDEMIKEGLFDEVKELYQEGYDNTYQSMQAIGYKEVIDYIERKTSKEEAVRLIKRNTRRFAKRQITWFKPDDRIRWFDISDYRNTYNSTLNKILSYIKERGIQIETNN
ncbi:MAG: tRNA (adenosine(37)-N6)-dimethylallyltransferase MiaA [Tissierellales bacterium]|nr:tRNA (adenosine(37)-N6)-dimethylallyltransferase MiaA [Tissierellales bacterium]